MITTKAGTETAMLTVAFLILYNLTTRPVSPTTGEKEYKLQDHLDSTRVVIHASGTVISRIDNDAWGEIVWQSGTEIRKGFIDKEKDAESGDHNFGVRQYSPENGGRFGSIDMIWESFRSLTPYHYSRNNPLVLSDPSGMADFINEDGGKARHFSASGSSFRRGTEKKGETALRPVTANAGKPETPVPQK